MKGEATRTLQYSFTIPVILHRYVESSKVSLLEKILDSKVHLNFATEVLKGFSPGLFNRLYVTHSKSNKNENHELKTELVRLR